MRTFTIILGLALMATTAHAAFKGSDVKAMCEIRDTFLAGYISGYIEKLNRDHDRLFLDSATNADPKLKDVYGDVAKTLGENICLRDGVSVGTLMSVVCDKVRNDDYFLTAPIEGVVRVGIMDAFPCERDD